MGDYGMKVSQAGYDVATATNTQLVMSSSFNMLKTALVGTVASSGSVAHNLAYVPIFMIFALSPSGSALSLITNGGADGTNLTIEGNYPAKYYAFYTQAV